MKIHKALIFLFLILKGLTFLKASAQEICYQKYMTVCFDIGNTNVFTGVLDSNNELQCSFRLPTETLKEPATFAEHLKQFFDAQHLKKESIRHVGICSVVPPLTEPLVSICEHFFQFRPYVLTANAAPFVCIPADIAPILGTDMVATAIAAYCQFRGNCIIVDLGTATTVSAMNADGKFLGAVILTGIQTSLNALTDKAAQIPPVPLAKPDALLLPTTIGSCQAGAYYGHLGAMREIIERLKENCFQGEPVCVIGTGGLANLYTQEGFFDVIDNSLILKGISIAAQANDCEAEVQVTHSFGL